jgi:hypothetical protein
LPALTLSLALALLTTFAISAVAALSFFLSLSDCRQHHRQREADAGNFHETLHSAGSFIMSIAKTA